LSTRRTPSFPRKRKTILFLELAAKDKLDYTPLLRRALWAGCAVRSGILPPQSGFRRDDDLVIFLRQ
jgi:hypothetical protein